MNDFIQAQSISFSYHVEEGQAPVNVFENLSVDIHQGEMTAVLGHNGSGKSTFAKHLNAILLPSGGKVYVDGIDTADEERLYDIRQEVGMVFQNPDNQIVATVVEEDVAFGLENIGVPPKEIRERVDRALMDVHQRTVHTLPDLLGRDADVLQAEGDVLLHHGGDNLVVRVLEHHPHLLADVVQPLLVGGVDAVHHRPLAARGQQNGVEVLGKGALARAVVSEHRGHLTLMDVNTQIFKDVDGSLLPPQRDS